MAKLTEKKWLTILPHNLTANGDSSGNIQISNASDFKVGMVVQLSSNTEITRNLHVKRIVSPIISLGPVNHHDHDREDVSAFLVGDAASILALEQDRPRISPDEVLKYAYEGEPTVALRTHLVDSDGADLGTTGNPLAVVGGGGGGGPASLTYESLLPLLNSANWLKLADFEEVTPTVVGDTTTLAFSQGGNVIANLVARYVDPTDWTLTLNAYVNDDDGTILLDDDDSELLLD